MSSELEEILADKNVKERTVGVSFTIKINTGNFESVDLNSSRSVTIEGDLTDEETNLIHKNIFLDCNQDIIKQWNFIERQYNRRASTGMPQKLAEKPKTSAASVKLEEVLPEIE